MRKRKGEVSHLGKKKNPRMKNLRIISKICRKILKIIFLIHLKKILKTRRNLSKTLLDFIIKEWEIWILSWFLILKNKKKSGKTSNNRILCPKKNQRLQKKPKLKFKKKQKLKFKKKPKLIFKKNNPFWPLLWNNKQRKKKKNKRYNLKKLKNEDKVSLKNMATWTNY